MGEDRPHYLSLHLLTLISLDQARERECSDKGGWHTVSDEKCDLELYECFPLMFEVTCQKINT